MKEPTSTMAKVTVAISVFNPGEFIAPCIESLLSQTMPPGDLEVIFVDDGSTDATPALLDRLADDHGHIQVVHQENSGWPGKPRNVGLEAATGDFVMFMDQDDALGAEAMQRMYDAGAGNHSDIVIGKVTSDFRPVPHFVWRDSIEKCTIRDHKLIHSLTPHKMFRRDFLLDSGIRYPEGKRRLEDQLFMVRSYLAAQCVSIVADYPCYFYLKRADGRNTASARPDPRGYYSNLREILDVIDTTVEPGAFRDSLLRRFYRVEMLGRLGDGRLRSADADYRVAMFDEIHRLAIERFPDTVPAGLEALHRVRAALVREGRLEDLREFAGRIAQVKATASIEHAQWHDGVLHADITAGLVLGDGSPVQLVRRDGRYVLDPRLVEDVVPDDLAEADIDEVTAEVVVFNRDTAIEWFVPAQIELSPQMDATANMAVRGHLSIDPLTIAGGTALKPGRWALMVRMRGCGLLRRTAIVPVDVAVWSGQAQSALLGSPPTTVVPRYTLARPYVVLDIDEGGDSFGKGMRKRLRRGPTIDRDGNLTAVLPAVTKPGTDAVPIVVELRAANNADPLLVTGGWLSPEGSDVVLRAQLPQLSWPDHATDLVVLWRLASSHRPAVRLGRVTSPRRRVRSLLRRRQLSGG